MRSACPISSLETLRRSSSVSSPRKRSLEKTITRLRKSWQTLSRASSENAAAGRSERVWPIRFISARSPQPSRLCRARVWKRLRGLLEPRDWTTSRRMSTGGRCVRNTPMMTRPLRWWIEPWGGAWRASERDTKQRVDATDEATLMRCQPFLLMRCQPFLLMLRQGFSNCLTSTVHEHEEEVSTRINECTQSSDMCTDFFGCIGSDPLSNFCAESRKARRNTRITDYG